MILRLEWNPYCSLSPLNFSTASTLGIFSNSYPTISPSLTLLCSRQHLLPSVSKVACLKVFEFADPSGLNSFPLCFSWLSFKKEFFPEHPFQNATLHSVSFFCFLFFIVLMNIGKKVTYLFVIVFTVSLDHCHHHEAWDFLCLVCC